MNNLNTPKTVTPEQKKELEIKAKEIEGKIIEDYSSGKNMKVVLEDNRIKLIKENQEVKISDEMCGLIEIYLNTAAHLLNFKVETIENIKEDE